MNYLIFQVSTVLILSVCLAWFYWIRPQCLKLEQLEKENLKQAIKVEECAKHLYAEKKTG